MWLKSQGNEAMSGATVPYPIQNSNLQNSNISVRPRVPRQEIPSLSGDPLQFQSSWEIFDSSVHSNTSFAPINKFSYLKTFLTGKAKDALNSLELTSGNCDKAVAILKSRFGDFQVDIQSNIDILLALHPISSSSNITDLRKIYDKVETVSRNLQRFEVSAEHFSGILIAVLMKKLPSDLRLQVSRNIPQGKWKISKLLGEFENELFPDPPLFSGSTLHRQAQTRQPKKIRFHVLIVNKTTQAINVQLLPMSKLENKFLLKKPDFLIVYV